MTFKEVIKLPYKNFLRHPSLMVFLFLAIVFSTFYPTDMKKYYSASHNGKEVFLIMAIEDYGRYTNTILPVVTGVLLRDWTGLRQLAVIGVSTLLATHIPKRVLNNIEIAGTRLGQRPSSPDSKHNMPSGHSSEAAFGAFFMMRRYSIWFGVIVLPILILIMYTRYMLNAHTISATIAGALIGVLVAWLFSTKMVEFKKRCACLFSKVHTK